MSEPAYYWNFTQTCQTCGETVQYSAGQREPHPCPENPALAIEGCNADTGLTERVEQALDDHDALTPDMTDPVQRDPATRFLADGLRAAFTEKELEQMQEGVVRHYDVLSREQPWGRLVDSLFAATYPHQHAEQVREEGHEGQLPPVPDCCYPPSAVQLPGAAQP